MFTAAIFVEGHACVCVGRGAWGGDIAEGEDWVGSIGGLFWQRLADGIFEEGIERPEFVLFELLCEGVVVALHAVHLLSEEQSGGDGRCGGSLIVEVCDEEVGFTLLIAAAFSGDESSDNIDPGGVF